MNTTEDSFTWAMPIVDGVQAGGWDISLADQILEALYYMIGSVALISNLFVIIVIFQYAKMRMVSTNIYVINQSIIDGLTGLLLILSRYFQYRFDRPVYGLAGEIYCAVWATGIPFWGLLQSSTYNLVALNLERYLAIVHPITHRMSLTRTKIVFSIVIIWLLGIILQMSYKASNMLLKD